MSLGRKGPVFPAPGPRCARLLRAVFTAGVLFVLAAGPTGCAETGERGDPPARAQVSEATPRVETPSFAPLVAKVLPAVVNVSATLKAGAGSGGENGGPDAPPSTLNELLRRFFELTPAPNPDSQGISLGSGFIIDPAGYVVTGNHVVANADTITVIQHDGTCQQARVVGRDAMTDLALLKIEADHPLPFVAWGDSDAAQVGDWVLAVGNPFGLGGTVSAGILSARGRNLNSSPYGNFLQIDASINQGDSGGPTFNLAGQVIGIMAAIYTPSGGSVGIAFAIPSALAKSVVDQLRTHGGIRHGWLGLQIQDVTPEIAQSLRLPKAAGALVADIAEGSPAARSGFRQGDVILTFNGRSIHASRDLSLLVAQTPPGRKTAMAIWRKGHEIALSATTGDLAQAATAGAKEPGAEHKQQPERTAGAMGLTLAPLTPARRQWFQVPPKVTGVLVLSIADDSPFADLDIAPGDVIMAIDQQPVAAPQDVVAKLTAATRHRRGAVLILLNRGGSGMFLALPVDALLT